MSLCANNNCSSFTLSNDSVTYIQCVATDKSITLKKVSLEEGIFYTREVDYYSKKASELKNK
jgi:hypothetical protein